MAATKPMFFKGCTFHPEEPIIRASLDLKNPKLLYCQECLEGSDQTFTGNLVKFSHLGDKLFEDYSRKYEDFLESVPCASPGEYKVKIEAFITQQKDKAEKEYNKIQTELLEIISNSKNEVFKTLDSIRTNLLTDCETSIEKATNLANPSTFEGTDITRDQMYKELTENEDSVAEVERRIRKRLELMKQLDDIKEETRLGFSRHQKAKLLETLTLTNSKEPGFYRDRLKGLDKYLEALLFTIEKEEEGDDRQLNVPSMQSHLIGVLNQSMGVCQESFEKIKDRVASFVEGMIGLYYSDSTNDESQAILDGMNCRPKSPRKNLYDKKIFPPRDEESATAEEADGLFDFEEAF